MIAAVANADKPLMRQKETDNSITSLNTATSDVVRPKFEKSQEASRSLPKTISAIFIPRPLPRAGFTPDLEAELGANPEFLSLMQNDATAFAACKSLQTQKFRKNHHHNHWRIDPDRAAQFIAAARQMGETPTSFHGAFTPKEAHEFASLLGNLGWRTITPEDHEADHAHAISLLKKALARPKSPTPEWALHFQNSFTETPYSKMINAVIDGQATHQEWILFINFYRPAKQIS